MVGWQSAGWLQGEWAIDETPLAFGKRRCGSGCFGLYPRACSGYWVFSTLRCGSTRGERRTLPGRHRVGADLATGPARIPGRQCCSVGARRTNDAEGLGRTGGGQGGDECGRSCRFGSVTHFPAGRGLREQSLRQALGLGNASRSATGDDAVTLRGDSRSESEHRARHSAASAR